MLQTTEKPGAVDRSYQLLALLGVCEYAARAFDDIDERHVPKLASDLANVMELASELASEVHDTLEKSEPKEVLS